MPYTINYARSLDEALAMICEGTTNVVSGIPIHDLLTRVSLVTAGLFDFDGTLHPGNTWASVGRRLPERLREKDTAIRTWYWEQTHHSRPQSSLNDPDWFHGHMPMDNQSVVDGAWVANDVHWYMEARLDRQTFTEVSRELHARMGAVELLQMMHPRAIITFGLETVAQDWLNDRDIKAAVAGTRLIFDESGRLSGHHPNIVASPTKRYAAHRFQEITGLTEPEIMVVGDTVVDIHMMMEHSFNVLIVPPSELERKMRDFRDNNLAVMWHRITMILASDSLLPLVELIQDVRSAS